ncbi:hypothetical protein RA27_01660 [Ruegeria sp. ANG-R]|uniref:TonB-dependent siderophore receptor n=1 Tax=Ruegeria sp. ANG-R TaxID=1577903 RepID=UPI0005802C65|nr:TonB-dependent siderophore receptor [Ruegeria sp. ANG-R]KIC42136.1 hypothetical protein RA27_01660 [Ruegeria sp. ANG-R]
MSTRSKVLAAGPLMISVGLAAQGVQAQSEPDEIVLDTITVEGDDTRPLESVEGYAAEAAGTALRGLPGDLRTTPRSVTVITTEQVEDQGAQSLEDAISYTPGVTVQTYGQDGRYDQFAIRGFEANTSSNYRDGMPLRTYGWGAWRTELFGAERIEVLRGTTSDLYGANQPGGIVNSVTKRPRFTFGGEVRGTLFGYGGGEVAVDVTGPASDRLAYRFVGVYNNSGTIFDEVDQSRIYLAPSFTWKATDRTNLTVFAQYQKDDVPDSYVIVPEYGSLRPDPVAHYGNDFYPNNPDRNTIETTQKYVGYELDHEFDNGLTFRSRARFARNDWFNETAYTSFFLSSSGVPDAIDTGVLTNFDVDQRTDETSLDNALMYKFQTGNIEGTIIGGIDYYKADYDNTYSFGPGGFVDLLNGTITPVPPAPAVTAESQDITQTGLYVNGYATINNNWVVNLGVRQDWVSRDFQQTSATGTLDQDNDQDYTSANVGVSYNFNNGVTVYGNASRSFDLPPLGADINGNPLDVERAKSYEVGTRFQPLGTNSLVSLALFQIDKTNTTQPVLGTPFVQQTGAVRSRGGELSANYNFANGLSVLAAYTYLDAKFRDDATFGDNRVARVPEHSASIWLSYAVPQVEGLTLGAGARYIGSRFSDEANTAEFELDSVTLVDASISYEWDNWQAILAGRNLGDEEYLTYCFGTPGAFSNGCSYGAGRSIEASLTRRF